MNAAAGVVQAAQEQGRQTAAGIALALDAAGLLMSPETAAELVRLREERHSTNESLSAAAERLRADRDRIDELEAGRPALLDDFIARCEVALGGCCSECDAAIAIVKGRKQAALDGAPVPERQAQGIADGITRRFAPTQALREDVTPMQALLAGQRAAVEDTHESPLHHRYRVGRDLPPLDGA